MRRFAVAAALTLGIAGVVGSTAPAGATASAPTTVALMDAGRAPTGLPPVSYTEAQVASMAPATAFVMAVNAERTVRGLRPLLATSAERTLAQAGNEQMGDPACVGACLGTVWSGAGGSTGTAAVLGVYYMIYQDGWGGSIAQTANKSCRSAGTPNCTGHRRTLLAAVPYGSAGFVAVACTGAQRTYPGYGAIDGSCAAVEWSVPTGTLGRTAFGPGGIWTAEPTGFVSTDRVPSYGTLSAYTLNAPIIGIVATPDGGGYWMLGADGGIFAFGDAGFYGSTGGMTLNAPVVGMASTPDGHGYWLVASDGGIFAFGDAAFRGSMGGHPLNKPIVAMAATGNGYYLMASDGGIFAFTVPFYGSTGGEAIPSPMVAIAVTPTGYDEVTQTGTVYRFPT